MIVAPICKGILTLTSLVILQRDLPPPNRPLAKELYEPSRLVTHGLPILLLLSRIISFSWGVIEAVAALAGSDLCPSPIRQWFVTLLVHSHQPPSQAIAQAGTLSPTFLSGICLTIAGSLLRRHCYRVLGRFFTFELSIREDHKLVTSGPYSIVRHPSYTGCIFIQVGQIMVLFDDNSWLVACSGLLPVYADSMVGVLWAARVFLLSVGYAWVIRMNNEDVMLQKSFGKEWREWAKKVPYRLFPGIY
ncbi:hypothetical protein EDC04DRAFT_3090347 [Pisolithus marmoratus]|nr:hypothetical protein EDC04DRAFT_3090347 [Pisolithus marmoratus]